MPDPIVIVGGGFAGATLAQRLERETDAEVIVLSRDNHLVFTPMLPEVAGRTISPLHVVVPGRQMTRRTTWIAAEVSHVHFDRKSVEFSVEGGGRKSLQYSHLVLACGMDVDFDTVPGMAAHALPLKSIGHGFRIGNEVIAKFEEATAEDDAAERQRLLTVAVIGGGFSGVEVAGHVFDLMQSIHSFYPRLAGTKPKLVLIQRGERILPELQHEKLSDFALKKLCEGGVEVLLKTSVEEVSAREVRLKGGQRIQYGLVIGTVGNTASPVMRNLGLPLERGRLKTTPEMRVDGPVNVWAIGDCAIVPNTYDGTVSPSTAQFALRQAKQLAANLLRAEKGQPLQPFYFRPQGLLASIGRRNGVAEVYGFQMSGLIAWFFWRGVYLAKIPSFARKVGVAVDWMMDLLFPANIVRIGGAQPEGIQRQHYGAGDTVFKKGDPASALYVIEKGRASVRLNGEQAPMAILKEGEYFGDAGFLSDQASDRHFATVLAETPLDVLALDRDGFVRLSRSLGVLHKDLTRSLRIRQAYEAYGALADRNPTVGALRVSDVMTAHAPVLTPSCTLNDLVIKLMEGSIGLPVVTADGALAGYCGRDEAYDALGRQLARSTPVEEFMRKNPPCIRRDQPLRQALVNLLRSGLHTIPVVDENQKLVGVLGLLELAQEEAFKAST